jgi:hypothetical protein
VPVTLPPPPDLDSITADAWDAKQLPPRDFMLGTALCTTSRWMVIGDTGVGKTLFVVSLAMAVATGRPMLRWTGARAPRVVMYIDGELPAETFQERIRLAQQLYGAVGVTFYAYNLDELERGGQSFEPFNTEAGRAWLEREIERVKPELIVFDSIMCLTLNALTDDRAWAPVAELMTWITGKRIAQVWVHHTGHDPTRGYGLKAREWRLDTVIFLAATSDEGLSADEGAPVEMRFKKHRLKTAANADQYQEWKINFGPQGWRAVGDPLRDDKRTRRSGATILTHAFCNAYDELADAAPSAGRVNGYNILKVSIDAVREKLKDGGFLDVDDQGRIEGKSREALRRIKTALLADGFKQEKGLIWRTKPPPSRRAYAD